MSDLNLITAREAPGGPPPGLGDLSRMRWSAKHPPIDPKVSFAGKTVLVTGANTGLGFEAALKYSALGADKLILGVRSVEKGQAAKDRILARTGRASSTIVVLSVDLSDFASVQAFIPALESVTSHLDVALLNAGLCNPSYEATAAGWEIAVQVNVLATALMAILLLPLLRTAAATGGTKPPAAAHLTFVNSRGHMTIKDEWLAKSPDKKSLLAAANDAKTWNPEKSYCLVKLLAMAAMLAIAQASSGSASAGPEIIVNAVCPDMTKTDLGRKFGLGARLSMSIFHTIFARTAEQGARSLVSATALGPESNGRFWHHDILHPMGDLASDSTYMEKTWREIVDVLVKTQPNVQQILGGRN
ncbi:hypothetical protein B0H63DRAFT_444378 [Podospora didyma]|uniref:Uncharacterized protein n=1 Tax=Podospora didyma TaxID=330526 RepID=A0AAE0P6A8_9PEZI|nr:hypothetical protein B0H63DRAFT_444378 [Podospora didyma]